MSNHIETVIPCIVNDAASGKRLLYVSGSFNAGLAQVAQAADTVTVLTGDIELCGRYRRLFKFSNNVFFASDICAAAPNADIAVFDSAGFAALSEAGARSVASVPVLIIPFENMPPESELFDNYGYHSIYEYSKNGAFSLLTLTTSAASSGVEVLSRDKLSLERSYSACDALLQSLELQNRKQSDKLAQQRETMDELYSEVSRLNSGRVLLAGPFVLLGRALSVLLSAFAPTRLFLKLVKALHDGGIATARERIRSYLGLSAVRHDAENTFVFRNKDEYVDFDSEYQENSDFSDKKTDVKVLAYYLPQYHTFKENDEWWGKGFTEWQNTSAALPRFSGHYQPRVPHSDIGYYDLSNIEVLKKQAVLAKQHGIYGFCFYYYWFSGKRLMEKPVDLLLEHSEIDLPFCLCWANENWTRAWDGQNRDVLIAQDYSDADDERFIIDLKKYIDDSRYIRINGKPLIVVYNPGQIPDCKKSFAKWREVARSTGIGEILIWTCRTSNNTAAVLGIQDCIDSEVEFPPHNTWLKDFAVTDVNLHGKSAKLLNYQKLVEGWTQLYKAGKDKKSGEKPVHHACMMAWDNAARRKDNWFTYHNFSLKSLYDWVLLICAQARRDFKPEERFVFINAWNEWAEGTYLEPDEKYGYANINTVSKALFNVPFKDDITFINNSFAKFPAERFNKKIAVQVHMFYTETLEETIESLNRIPYPFDCFFSTDTNEKAALIRQTAGEKCHAVNCRVDVFENRGRDVAPFIMQMRDVIDNYDYICHIHSKRTVTGDHGNDWRHYIFRHMFGDEDYMSRLFDMLETDAHLGIVFPETFPPLEYQAGWGGNLAGCRALLEKTGIDATYPQTPVFPVGNMFWAKTPAVRALFKADIKAGDFAVENGQVNATIAHCIERSWVFVAAEYGFGYRKIMNNLTSGAELPDTRRIAFYMHFNADGALSETDYKSLIAYRKIFEKIIFISNSPLNDDDCARLGSITDTLIFRENTGFDFAGWKYGLEQFGYDNLKQYDSVALINNSTFAPVFDMKKIIAQMYRRGDDFWGITLFPNFKDGSYIGKRGIPEHLQSYFIMFEKKIVQSDAIKGFFDTLKSAQSFTQAVANGEVELTAYMRGRGFTYSPYITESYYICNYLETMSLPYEKPASLLLLGCPLIKKKAYNYMTPAETQRLEYLLGKLNENG